MRSILIAVLLALTLPLAANAQTVNAFSLERLSIGGGAGYSWFNAAEVTGPQMPFKHEWEVGLYGAYNLVAPPVGEAGTRLSLVGSSRYGLDNKTFYSSVGLRVTLFNGSKR
mgnify:CR=1 FL=1